MLYCSISAIYPPPIGNDGKGLLELEKFYYLCSGCYIIDSSSGGA